MAAPWSYLYRQNVVKALETLTIEITVLHLGVVVNVLDDIA